MLKNIQKGVKKGHPSNGQTNFHKETKTHQFGKKLPKLNTVKDYRIMSGSEKMDNDEQCSLLFPVKDRETLSETGRWPIQMNKARYPFYQFIITVFQRNCRLWRKLFNGENYWRRNPLKHIRVVLDSMKQVFGNQENVLGKYRSTTIEVFFHFHVHCPK